MREVHVVVPDGIDDPLRPSGGNVYDRRVCTGLRALGWTVREHEVVGSWRDADPDGAGRSRLASVLARIPDGATVLIDGLIACVTPQVLRADAGRLRLVALVHMTRGGSAEREALRAAAVIVVTSTWTKHQLTDRHGLSPDHIRVVLPGVDPVCPVAGGPYGDSLLSVGAVTPVKGQDVLIDALMGLRDQRWRSTVVGALDVDPSFAGTVRRRCVDAGLSGRVRFTGALAGQALAAAYAQADLLVLPSRAETFGMVLTEALARGLPAVATEVGGVPEALGRTPDGRLPGMLVAPEDPVALAGALRVWLIDPDAREEWRAAARARRLTLTGWSRTVQQIAGVLEATRVREK